MNTKTTEQTTALTFPCDFPVKIIGSNNEKFEKALLDIAKKYYPSISKKNITYQPSKNNKYVSITVTVPAESKEQLDSFYRDLSACEHILMAL